MYETCCTNCISTEIYITLEYRNILLKQSSICMEKRKFCVSYTPNHLFGYTIHLTRFLNVKSRGLNDSFDCAYHTV